MWSSTHSRWCSPTRALSDQGKHIGHVHGQLTRLWHYLASVSGVSIPGPGSPRNNIQKTWQSDMQVIQWGFETLNRFWDSRHSGSRFLEQLYLNLAQKWCLWHYQLSFGNVKPHLLFTRSNVWHLWFLRAGEVSVFFFRSEVGGFNAEFEHGSSYCPLSQHMIMIMIM